MKKSNSKSKALGAFWKLGAVVLITATIFFVACKQTNGGGGGGKPAPTPKHAITFSVDSTTPNGTLKAKADGVPETSTSPINVEEGKTVTFTAKANDGYSVKSWTLDGSAVNGTNTEYKLKVSKPATVKVSFEAIPPTKYTVTLNQTEGGTVTSSPAIPADKLMPKDTEITFTATADDGYKIGKWTVTPAEALQAGTGADGSETAKVKITANTTVSVSFTKKTYAVTFSVDSTTPNGILKAKAEGITETGTSPITVEHGKEVTFTATADDGYKIGKWTVTGSVLEGSTGADGSETAKVKITADTTVSVSFELNPVEGGAVLILSPDKLNIKVKAKTADGSDIAVEGCTETTLTSNAYTGLHAKGTLVILKGKITELECPENQLTALNVQGLTALQELWCSGNQLTELNVQGLTALQTLWCYKNQLTSLNVQGCAALQKLGCYSNKLNAQAMTEILNALPAREAGDYARAYLYTEETDEPEGNYKDFTQPAELKAALDGAKKRNWKLGKINESGNWEDI